MKKYVFSGPTDKQPGGWHQAYIPVYERLFAPHQDTEMDILEIGVDGGYSLIAHSGYFYNARVIGMDINPIPESIVGSKSVLHIQHDAYSQSALDMLAKLRFAVMIDDGPHSIESQEYFVRNYPKLLTYDGIAVVEDVQDIAHIDRLHAALPEGFIGYPIDLRRINNRYDDILFVVTRK
jgi:23S rRNA U2552 (ribose-2'-O)-methylase RlmE/FtsJ